MEIGQAIEIIEEYRQEQGIFFLEALIEIREDLEEGNVAPLLGAAYRRFMVDGQRMFAPA